MAKKRTVVLYEGNGTTRDKVIVATSDRDVVEAVHAALNRRLKAANEPPDQGDPPPIDPEQLS